MDFRGEGDGYSMTPDANSDRNFISFTKDMLESSRKSSSSSDRIFHLEACIDRLLLINRALWEIIQERFSLNEDFLREKLNEIDLRDGALDGKLKKSMQKCARCKRTLHPRHKVCLYCGYHVIEHDVFDEVK